MKTLIQILTVLAVGIFYGCSQSQYGISENDDLYFSSKDRYAERGGSLGQEPKASGEDFIAKDDYTDEYFSVTGSPSANPNAASAYAQSQSNAAQPVEYFSEDAAEDDGTVINNFYGSTNYYENDYASQFRRFNNTNVGLSYYDPFFVDPYWNYGWGRPGWNIGWNSWSGWNVGFGWGVGAWGGRPWGWNNPWRYDPWGWNNPWAWNNPWRYDPWGWNNPWAWNNPWGWNNQFGYGGWNNGYAFGYQDGFNDGFYGGSGPIGRQAMVGRRGTTGIGGIVYNDGRSGGSNPAVSGKVSSGSSGNPEIVGASNAQAVKTQRAPGSLDSKADRTVNKQDSRLDQFGQAGGLYQARTKVADNTQDLNPNAVKAGAKYNQQDNAFASAGNSKSKYQSSALIRTSSSGEIKRIEPVRNSPNGQAATRAGDKLGGSRIVSPEAVKTGGNRTISASPRQQSTPNDQVINNSSPVRSSSQGRVIQPDNRNVYYSKPKTRSESVSPERNVRYAPPADRSRMNAPTGVRNTTPSRNTRVAPQRSPSRSISPSPSQGRNQIKSPSPSRRSSSPSMRSGSSRPSGSVRPSGGGGGRISAPSSAPRGRR